MTREQWLVNAVTALQPLFKNAGYTIPPVRVSVGFPGGNVRKVIGEYWHAHATSDSVPQIFISPVLNTALEHLDTLVHELIHACTPGHGHRGEFKQLALRLGMVGPMKSACAGPLLKKHLVGLEKQLGVFPHGGVALSRRKKQRTRLVKVSCWLCGYTARTTLLWIVQYGPPICPCSLAVMGVG